MTPTGPTTNPIINLPLVIFYVLEIHRFRGLPRNKWSWLAPPLRQSIVHSPLPPLKSNGFVIFSMILTSLHLIQHLSCVTTRPPSLSHIILCITPRQSILILIVTSSATVFKQNASLYITFQLKSSSPTSSPNRYIMLVSKTYQPNWLCLQRISLMGDDNTTT